MHAAKNKAEKEVQVSTSVGFFLFVGLVLGAIAGAFLPLAPWIWSVAGAVLGVVVAIVSDRRGQRMRATATDESHE